LPHVLKTLALYMHVGMWSACDQLSLIHQITLSNLYTGS